MTTGAVTSKLKQYILEMDYQVHVNLNRNAEEDLLETDFAEIGPFRLKINALPADFVNNVIGIFDASIFEYLSEIQDWYAEKDKGTVLAIYPQSKTLPTVNALIDQGFRLSSYFTYWIKFLENFDGTQDQNCKKIKPEANDLFTDIGMQAVDSSPGDDFYLYFRQIFGRYCNDPYSDNYFYFYGNQPVATGSVSYVGDTCVLSNGAVLPSQRGNQIHQKLVKTRLADARARGMKYAIVGTDVNSTSGRNMERLGFQKAFTLTHYWLEINNQ